MVVSHENVSCIKDLHFSFFSFIQKKMTKSLPTYDELPIDSKHPPHTAWGVWGDDDNLGTLNLLTEERVLNVYHIYTLILFRH